MGASKAEQRRGEEMQRSREVDQTSRGAELRVEEQRSRGTVQRIRAEDQSRGVEQRNRL
jgi:hypothetical protein